MLGGAVAALLTRQLLRRRRNRRAAGSLDGEEPIEAILIYDDSIDIDDLADLSARADATVLAQAEAAAGGEPMVVVTSVEEITEPLRRIGQTGLSEDDRAQAHGESWIDALQEDAIENGPEAETVLVFLDEADLEPPSDKRDRPIADRGSAGPRGL